jgi:hypothetical protein
MMMINRRQCLAALAAAVAATVLSGCQLDMRAPLRVSQILAVAESGTPAPVSAAISGTFITVPWCRDEGTMAVETLSTPNVPLQLAACEPAAGKKATGQFQLATNLVRTDGGPDDATILLNVVGDDTARFAVFPHAKHKHLLSLGLFLNLPRLEMDKQKLLAMPVFKRGGDRGQLTYTFTIDIMNDTDHPAKFYLSDVSAGGDLPADEAILMIPPGGMDTVSLDADTQAKLAGNGWVNFATLIRK